MRQNNTNTLRDRGVIDGEDDSHNPNYALRIMDGKAFNAWFQLGKVKHTIFTKRDGCIPNHTVIVVDDAGVEQRLLARIINEGRNAGISCFVVMQDMEKKGLLGPELLKQMSGFVFFKQQRASHNMNYYTSMLLSLTKERGEEFGAMMMGLKKGECLIANNTKENVPFYLFPPLADTIPTPPSHTYSSAVVHTSHPPHSSHSSADYVPALPPTSSSYSPTHDPHAARNAKKRRKRVELINPYPLLEKNSRRRPHGPS